MTLKIRILVVDDDEVDCLSAKRALANSPLPVKFEVETASTMAKGIDKLAHGGSMWHCSIWGCPTAAGLETVKGAVSAAGEIPVVVLRDWRTTRRAFRR